MTEPEAPEAQTDPERKKQETTSPQEVPAQSGGPELSDAEQAEDDDKRA